MADPIEIAPGARETLISAGDVQEFFADVRSDVELFLSTTFGGTGERAEPNDRGFLSAPRGTEVIAFNPGNQPARIELSPTGRTASWFDTDGFTFERQDRTVTRVFEEQNRNSIDGGQVTDSGSGTALPSIDVPDGFAVAVQADPSNTDNLTLRNGDNDVLAILTPNDTAHAEVNDPSLLSVMAVAGTQTAIWSVET